jgi:hypothetical protein
MSYSNYQLNQKIENLQYQVNNLTPPIGGFVPINLDTTINDIKTFTSLPRSTQIPTLNDQLVNKLYVDTISGTPALSAVLTAGNNAGGLSITNLNNLDVGNITVGNINGSAYPPIVPADTLANVLIAGNTAGSVDINMNFQDILNVGNMDVGNINVGNINVGNINGSAYPPAVDNLSAVLNAGNIADNSIFLQDGLSTNLMEKTGITLLFNDGITGATNINLLTSNISGNINVSYTDIGGNTSQTFIKSQANQTETSVNVIDNTAPASGTRTDITLGGAILDTQTATDLNTTIFSQHSQQLIAGVSGQAFDSLVWNGTISGITSSFSTVVSPTTLSNELKYDNTSSQISTACKMDVNSATSSLLVSAVNILGSTSQFIRLETPQSGDALIEHQVIGTTNRNLGLTTTGNLLITADNMSSTATNLTLTSPSTGNITAPLLTLTNTNTNGSVAMECFKNKPTASVNGEVLFTQSVFGKDSGNAKQEFTRINHTVRDATAGVEDGSIEFGCFVNGAINTFLQINGNENEINCLRNIDMGGNSIRTSAGNLEITTASSSGAGNMNLTGKSAGITTVSATTLNLTASSILNMSATGAGAYMSATINDDISLTSTAGDIINTLTAGDLVFNGVNIQSNTASGNSGEHLRIKLNGVYYKIKLEND